MYHFFVKQEDIGQSSVRITGSDVNHIKNVLRMKCGEQVLIGDGVSMDYLCSIASMEADCVTAQILSVQKESTELPAKLVLFQGLPKGDKMELIIQKAVELGAYQIVPVETKRTVVKLDAKKEDARVKRWNAVSESAAKQSKRRIIPEITHVMSFQKALEYAQTFDLNVIPYEHARGMKQTREILSGLLAGMTAGIFIGPEGGFEETEVADARNCGVKEVTLGNRILRTETAGLAILSVLMFQLENEETD